MLTEISQMDPGTREIYSKNLELSNAKSGTIKIMNMVDQKISVAPFETMLTDDVVYKAGTYFGDETDIESFREMSSYDPNTGKIDVGEGSRYAQLKELGFGDKASVHLVEQFNTDFDNTAKLLNETADYVDDAIYAFNQEGQVFTAFNALELAETSFGGLGLEFSDLNPNKMIQKKIVNATAGITESESRKSSTISLVNATMGAGYNLSQFGEGEKLEGALKAMRSGEAEMEDWLKTNNLGTDDVKGAREGLAVYEQIERIMTSSDSRISTLRNSKVYKEADGETKQAMVEDAGSMSTGYLSDIAHYSHMAYLNYFSHFSDGKEIN